LLVSFNSQLPSVLFLHIHKYLWLGVINSVDCIHRILCDILVTHVLGFRPFYLDWWHRLIIFHFVCWKSPMKLYRWGKKSIWWLQSQILYRTLLSSKLKMVTCLN
jgi:hypothetical protein